MCVPSMFCFFYLTKTPMHGIFVNIDKRKRFWGYFKEVAAHVFEKRILKHASF